MLVCALAFAPNIAPGARQPDTVQAVRPVVEALEQTLARSPQPDDVAAFYAAHGHPLLWVKDGRVRPEAHALLAAIATADRDGLEPADYDPDGVRQALAAAAALAGPAELARAELALSRAYAAYASDLRRPKPQAAMIYTDASMRDPQVTPRAALEALWRSPDFSAHLMRIRRMHPLYEALREALAEHRGDAAERLILANMERTRALPADPGPRYILVDAAAGRLRLYEHGEVVDEMAVVVGRRSDPTPVMAGLMRYASFNPYWNLPVTMVRDELAPRVLREGSAFLAAEDMEILSDWTPDARVLHPDEVDWAAVAAGEQPLRVRRRPGPDNILGQVKLMLPNRLGIYLHDTPDKTAFDRDRRTLSAGCIRLEDAMRLARRLLGRPDLQPPPGWDVRMDLPEPVPVYIVYLTAAVEDGRLVRRPDIYGRDAPLMAALDAERAAG